MEPSTYNLPDHEECASCGASYEGRFCPQCGEKKLDRKEMTLGYFFGSVWNAVTFTDVKFLRSIHTLLFKPGLLTLEYFRGRRKLYTPPLALFFFINLVYFLYQPVDALNSSYTSQTSGQSYSEWARQAGEAKREKAGVSQAVFQYRYNQMTSKVSKLFLVVFILIYALGVALVNAGRQKLFYFHILTATHYVSFSILGLLILFPILMWLIMFAIVAVTGRAPSYNLNDWYFTVPLLSVLCVYAFAMQKRLYAQSLPLTFLKSILLVAAFALSVLGYRFFLFATTLTFL